MLYNEEKISRGEAKLILASGFATDIEQLSFKQKLKRFEYRTELRPSVKLNSLHISLNFDVSETLKDEKMQDIAARYMELLGCGDQPFLVYRHQDTAHPHMHITSVLIRADGTPIHVYQRIQRQWKKMLDTIEWEFGLLTQVAKKNNLAIHQPTAEAARIKYGEISTMRAISQVLEHVIRNYHFSSFSEFNAVLRQYQVEAYRGHKNSPMYQHEGLLYYVLDNHGKRIGKPIRASAFYHKPTLKNIKKKFKSKPLQKVPLRQSLKNRLDDVLLLYDQISKETLHKALAQKGIFVHLPVNKQHNPPRVFYVDSRYKTVFKGSDLGAAYTVQALYQQIGKADVPKDYFIDVTLDKDLKILLKPEAIKYKILDPKSNLLIATRPLTHPAYLPTRQQVSRG